MAYIGRQPITGQFEKQQLTADSSTTSFALDWTVGSTSALIVSVGGVLQEPDVAYNLSGGGTNIVFTAAPTNGDRVYVHFLGQAITQNITDLNGTELILDANANTSITADTDDQIDIKIAGADDFQFTANTFTAQSGSTIAAQALTATTIAVSNDGTIGSAGDADSMAISSAGVVTFTQAPVFPDGSLAVVDLDIDGATDIGEAIVDADLFVIDNGAGGTNRKTAASRLKTFILAANSIDSDAYVDGSIDLAHMSVNSIDSDQYVDGSIDLAHMSVNSIDSDQYVDGSIDTAHIADDQVTLAKMAGLARGKIIYGDSSGNPAALTVGSSGQALVSDGTDISWGSGGAISTYSNSTNNRVITSVDSSSVNSEANLTFDGSTLGVTGAATVSTTLGVTGIITGSTTVIGTTFEPTATTSAGDNAAIGYTSGEGLLITGQGSTNDITVKNDANAVVFRVPTGSDDVVFGDNAKIYMGTDSDLGIWHDGTNAFVNNTTGSGALDLRASTVRIRKSSGDENMAVFDDDGAVSLYYDNAKKFETISTGTKSGDGIKGTYGDSSDLQLYHDGGNSFVDDTATGDLILRGSGSIYLKQYSNNEIMIQAAADGGVDLYHNGTKKAETESDGLVVGGHCYPSANDTHDLGKSGAIWRDIYTGDLNLTNIQKENGNDVDGTKGSWKIQEGENDLFIMNQVSGKKYRFKLEEMV